MGDENLGARLRGYRLKAGLSLQGLADKVGSSKAHIWDLEQGKAQNPSLQLLTELSKALGVPIRSLIGETDEISGSDGPELAPLFRDLRGLNQEQIEMIQAMTSRLKDMKNGPKS
jgi:transcriptional regulator with XRE-family HTH domain